MKDTARDLKRIIDGHSQRVGAHVDLIKQTISAKRHELAALRGGSDAFASEASIDEHFRNLRMESRQKGREALAAMLADLQRSVDVALTINAVTARDIRPGLELVKDEAALRRFVQTAERKGDYTALLACASFPWSKGHDAAGYARKLSGALGDFETSLADVVRKSRKHVESALRADESACEHWKDWLDGACGDVERAAEAVQAVVDGSDEQNPMQDALRAWADRQAL